MKIDVKIQNTFSASLIQQRIEWTTDYDQVGFMPRMCLV